MGFNEFMMKFNSMPESEPLYTIIKSRTIKTSEIKDKEERKYWNKLKKINAIPYEYLSTQEVLQEIKNFTREKKL